MVHVVDVLGTFFGNLVQGRQSEGTTMELIVHIFRESYVLNMKIISVSSNMH